MSEEGGGEEAASQEFPIDTVGFVVLRIQFTTGEAMHLPLQARKTKAELQRLSRDLDARYAAVADADVSFQGRPMGKLPQVLGEMFCFDSFKLFVGEMAAEERLVQVAKPSGLIHN